MYISRDICISNIISYIKVNGFNTRLVFTCLTLICIISGIGGKAKDSFSANTTRPQQYQRLFLFSNGVLTITPKLQVPYELTGSVASGLSIGLPIKVRFQSQFQLMSEWIKQLLITKAQGLNKNLNSFGLSLSQLVAYVNGFTNADQHMAKTKSHTSINANNIGTNGGDVVFDNDGNLMDSYTSNTSTVDNGSHVLPDNIGGKGNDSLYFQNKLAKSSRFQARSQLYKTIEISHSTLGRSCLQRAICEVSQTPLIAPNTGLIGQLIDMFLTIDPIHEEYSDDIDDYIEAQAYGVKSYVRQLSTDVKNYSFTDECLIQYGIKCPFSLFNIMHILPVSLQQG